MLYFFIPLLAWVVAGATKFVVNYIRFGKEAKARIGYGGFPSNHTTIVSSTTIAIGFHEGFDSAMFALGVAVTMIVIIDALGLRRQVGYHAETLNKIAADQRKPKHREIMGHTKGEVLGGLVLGTLIGYASTFVM